MKYNYQKLDIETYIESLYADGVQESKKLSDEALKETILNIGAHSGQTGHQKQRVSGHL
jgi:hypothetical protein